MDGITPLLNVSERHNAVYSIDDFHLYLIQTCVHNVQVAGCAKSAKSMTGTVYDIDNRRSSNMSISHTMLITEEIKKKPKTEQDETVPHQKYTAFATNRPNVDPKLYKIRWDIVTGCCMIESARAKTHSKNPAVRLLYFVCSVVICNAWVAADTMLAYITGIQRKRISCFPTAYQEYDSIMPCLFGYSVLSEPPLQ